MNVYLESWSPNETLKRFYVKNDIDGSEIGYIQLSYKSVGYGNGYYSEHRAAKGDFGTLELVKTSLVGDEEVLQKVIDKALQINDVEIANSLGLISRNANVYFWEKGAARKAKQKAQKNLTIFIESRDDYEEYLDYVVESRACGYEVESYREWRGDESAKDKAMEKIQGRIDRDEQDLY